MIIKYKIMESVLDVRLNIPKSDMHFFGELAVKIEWTVKNKKSLWNEYLKNSPVVF
jgi:hypothetical protein